MNHKLIEVSGLMDLDLLPAIQSYCPVLSNLAIEGSQITLQSLLSYENPFLRILVLQKVGFKLSGMLRCEGIERLEYLNGMENVEETVDELIHCIGALPEGLKELVIGVKKCLVNR